MEALQPSSLLQPIDHVELPSPKAAAAPLPESPGLPNQPAGLDMSGRAETWPEVSGKPDDATVAPTSIDVIQRMARVTGR